MQHEQHELMQHLRLGIPSLVNFDQTRSLLGQKQGKFVGIICQASLVRHCNPLWPLSLSPCLREKASSSYECDVRKPETML